MSDLPSVSSNGRTESVPAQFVDVNESGKDSSVLDENVEEWKMIKADEASRKRETRKILMNIVIICFAFLGNFTSYNGASTLQSSLNPQEGLGTASLAVTYGTLILSSMFLPTYVIKKLGCKWTMVIAICGYVTYPLANFYPHWATLIPSSIVVGICAAPLWSAKCTYLTTAAKKYAYLSDETMDAVVNRFFGIFFLFFQSGQIIGNLISSFILSSDAASNLEFPTCYNESYIEQNCGKGDCQGDLNAARILYNSSECPVSALNSAGPSNATIYTLMGIYTAVNICGALVMAFGVDRIKVRTGTMEGPFALLIATFKQLRDKRQVLLIPITIYGGFEQAFMFGDFTRSFVTCPLGVNWVGFVMICYAACDAVCSLVFGGSEKYIGRLPLFTGAFLTDLALIITFQVWVPYPHDAALFFVLPALWGIADAVWQTQLNSFYGYLFVASQEASFSNYKLWESTGFLVAFAYQSSICVSAKLWVLLSFLLLGIALYYFVEVGERKKITATDGKSIEDNRGYDGSVDNGLNEDRITAI